MTLFTKRSSGRPVPFRLAGRGGGFRWYLAGFGCVNGFLARIAAWLTAGYPEGVPGPDRVPLMALLTRRLTNEEAEAVAQDLMNRAHLDGGPVDHVDLKVMITGITDELPRAEDIERVRRRLAMQGWPLDDPRPPEPKDPPSPS
ncbi:Protein of unknown function [Mycolicibacterium neoaurum]|uniref:EndoIII-related endonuclease n=1 Tax=Mycolicibacterium neoaurum TaxID=1795 RepID=A0AAV2WRZ3_MYCNE|nr:putative endoIII-related endonuclease [Mycolicibacterium neoaurum]SDD03555.1 Protein of unknown function [Mycolicibacterium neoaurum]